MARGASAPRRGVKTLSIISTLGVTLATMSSGITATANAETIENPVPNNESAYDNAAEYGHNIVGEETLPRLKPTAEGGSVAVQEGDKTEYKFTFDTGFPEDPNNATAQRWIKVTLTEDPKVPFDKDENGYPQVQGLPDDGTFNKLGDHQWEVIFGNEYLDMFEKGFVPNNPGNSAFSADGGDTPWAPPAKLTLTIPATVESAEGDNEFAKGSATITSGRLVSVQLQDTDVSSEFVSNDGAGLCTWKSTYQTKMKGEDAGHWLKWVDILSNPSETEHFESLPEQYKGLAPQLVDGTVTVDGQDTFNVDARTAEEDERGGYLIGRMTIDQQLPPFNSDEWLSENSTIDVEFQFKNPCGEKVDENIVANQPDNIPGLPGDWEIRPEYTYAQSSRVDAVISRPPEDVSATAEFSFTKEESPVEDSQFSVAKKLAPEQAETVKLEDGSFTTSHVVTVTNENPETPGASDKVIDTPREIPGFEIDKVTVDGAEQPLTGGSVTVSDGVEFAEGDENTKDFQVEVTYKRAGETTEGFENAFTEDEANQIGTCVAGDGADEFPAAEDGKGIINTVELGEDNASDTDEQGRANNWDCVGVTADEETPTPGVPGSSPKLGWLIPVLGILGLGGVAGSVIGEGSSGSSTPAPSEQGEQPTKPETEAGEQPNAEGEAQQPVGEDAAQQPTAEGEAGQQAGMVQANAGESQVDAAAQPADRSLANTGASIGIPLAIAGVFLLLGAAFIALRRKA